VVSYGLIVSGPRRLILQKGGTACSEAASKSSWKEVYMKKLAVVVMMTAVATFMPAAMASAEHHDWWGIHGEYAMIAAGSCLHSTLGFNTDLTPKTGSVVWGAPVMTEGIWTFEHDGTGVVSLTNHIITLLSVCGNYSSLVRISNVPRDRNIPAVGSIDPLCNFNTVCIQTVISFITAKDECELVTNWARRWRWRG
jgi:hypothetical protein